MKAIEKLQKSKGNMHFPRAYYKQKSVLCYKDKIKLFEFIYSILSQTGKVNLHTHTPINTDKWEKEEKEWTIKTGDLANWFFLLYKFSRASVLLWYAKGSYINHQSTCLWCLHCVGRGKPPWENLDWEYVSTRWHPFSNLDFFYLHHQRNTNTHSYP